MLSPKVPLASGTVYLVSLPIFFSFPPFSPPRGCSRFKTRARVNQRYTERNRAEILFIATAFNPAGHGCVINERGFVFTVEMTLSQGF